ncbi:MAG: hypothetical protein ACKPEO_04915 [Sphaerospermopsis kisseleviana]
MIKSLALLLLEVRSQESGGRSQKAGGRGQEEVDNPVPSPQSPVTDLIQKP